MEYIVRDTILPVYFQIGYNALENGLSIGDIVYLDFQPISALHYHNCLEFGICCAGTGEMHIENRIYRFSPGDISYVGANIPHFSKADTDGDCKWRWIFLDPMQLTLNENNDLLLQLKDISEKGYNGVFHPEEHPRLAAFIHALRNHCPTYPYSDLDATFLVGQILIESARIGNVDKSKVRLKISEKLKPALLFIRNNYMDPQKMSEENISASCGLSISQFRKLFRQDIGISLPQYINNTRMSSAAYLICNTDKKILTVALESGFYDISNFNKLFRKAFGMTPKEMRIKQRLPNRSNPERKN